MLRRFNFPEVKVFVGEETGRAWATLCDVGVWIADLDCLLPMNPTPCHLTDCVCHWECDEPLRPATAAEARTWFVGRCQQAAQAPAPENS